MQQAASIGSEDALNRALIRAVWSLSFEDQRGGTLPRGRHDLSRDDVETTQRARILDATARTVTELTYAETTTRAIIERAGVSTRTFYAWYGSKEDVFLAAYTLFDELLLEQASRPITVMRPRTAIREAVGLWLRSLASWPLFTRLHMVEARAAGPQFDAHRLTMIRRMTELTSRTFAIAHEQDPGVATPGDDEIFLLMLGMTELAACHIAQQGAESLSELEAPIVSSIERCLYGTPPVYAAGD